MQTIEGLLSFVKANRQTVLKFLAGAKSKITIAKPGYYKEEIELLLRLAKVEKVKCCLFIEPGENPIRFGFGEKEALDLIKQNLDILNVQTASSIRISLVVVDDMALVYAPVALSWEEEPENVNFPNGFLGGAALAQSIVGQIEGIAAPSIPANVIPFPGCSVLQKNHDEIKIELIRTVESLEKNPPVDPSRLRQITFYRNQYKILKTEIRGVNISKKSISLRQFNSMIPKTDERLKSSWNVFTKADIDSLKQMTVFKNEIKKVLDDHTLDAGRFGHIIKISKKKDFETLINSKKDEFIKKMKNPVATAEEKIMKSKQAPLFGSQKNETLDSIIEKGRQGLVEYLFSEINKPGISLENLFKNNREFHLKIRGKLSDQDREKTIAEAIRIFVINDLKFPDPDEMLNDIGVKFDYYDVSDELLNDEEFLETINQFNLKMRNYNQGYEPEANTDKVN